MTRRARITAATPLPLRVEYKQGSDGKVSRIVDADGAPLNDWIASNGAMRARVFYLENEIQRLRRARPRDCMACGETFESDGPHNRMCDPCRRSEAHAVKAAWERVA